MFPPMWGRVRGNQAGGSKEQISFTGYIQFGTDFNNSCHAYGNRQSNMYTEIQA